MSHRPTRLPRYAAKSVAPLDPAALAIGTVADIAAGLSLTWRKLPHGGEEADVGNHRIEAFFAGFRICHRGNSQTLTSGQADSYGEDANKRAAVLALASHLRDRALKAIPLAQSGAGAPLPCTVDEAFTVQPFAVHGPSAEKVKAAIDKAPKPTPAEVAKARGIRVGDRVRVVAGPKCGLVTTVHYVGYNAYAFDILVNGFPYPVMGDAIELLPAEAPAFGVNDKVRIVRDNDGTNPGCIGRTGYVVDRAPYASQIRPTSVCVALDDWRPGETFGSPWIVEPDEIEHVG